MTLTIDSKKIVRALSWIVLSLIGAHILGQAADYYYSLDGEHRLVELFNLDRELNIPSVYSSATLLLCAVLLGMIALSVREKKAPYFWHWLGLGAGFLYMSLDELLSIHEKVSVAVRHALDTTGFLWHAWVIPYGLLAVVIAVAYLRFLRHLPQRTRWFFVLAGGLFLGGAVGVEMLSAQVMIETGKTSLLWRAVTTVEEALEMAGVVVFIYALLEYIHEKVEEVHLRFQA